MKVIQWEGRIGAAVEDWVGHPLRVRDDDAYAEAKVRWPELTAAVRKLVPGSQDLARVAPPTKTRLGSTAGA